MFKIISFSVLLLFFIVFRRSNIVLKFRVWFFFDENIVGLLKCVRGIVVVSSSFTMEYRVNFRFVASVAACDELCLCVFIKIIVVFKFGMGMFGNFFFYSVLWLCNKFVNFFGKMCVTASLSFSFVIVVVFLFLFFGLMFNSKYFIGFVWINI